MKFSRLFKLSVGASLLVMTASGYAADASFNIDASLYSSVVVRNTNPLIFAAHEVVTSNTAVVVAPTDSGTPGTGAKFSATGDPNRAAVGTFTSKTATISCTTGACAGDSMQITDFTTGGDMAADGSVTFPAGGTVSNLLVGGTMNITPDDKSGTYAGTATFSLNYT